MNRLVSVVVVACLVFALIGCSKNDDINKSVIEQQRINLATQKQNQETLDKIREREKELLQIERKNEDTLKGIAEKTKQLAEHETNLTNKENTIRDEAAKNQAVLVKQQDALRDISKQNAIATRMAKLAEARMPFAERLADITAKAKYADHLILHGPTGRGPSKEDCYNECLSLINSSGAMEIDSDVVFEDKAKQVMIRYLERDKSVDGSALSISLRKGVTTIRAMRMNDTEMGQTQKLLPDE